MSFAARVGSPTQTESGTHDMSDAKNTVEVKGLGTVELVREPSKETIVDGKTKPAKSGVYKMSDAELYKFYENHGVPNAKTVIKAINNARAELGTASAEFLAPKVKETGADWELRCGTSSNNVNTGIMAMREYKDVQTGKTNVVYGKFWMKVRAPNPLESDKYKQLSDDIEAALRAKSGL